MALAELLLKVSALSALQQRKVSAVLGAVVADAAAQPIHWIYDDSVMTEVLAAAGENPEFISPSANPYYCLPTGKQSGYGDELLVLLESLVACKGFEAADSAKRLFTAFGPGSPYDNPLPALYSKNMKDKSMYPITGAWQSFIPRRFVECYSSGKDVCDLEGEDKNVDPNSIARLVALVALYAGKPELLDKAEEAAHQMQYSDMVLAVVLTACRVMEQYILHGKSHDDLVEKVVEELKSQGRLHPLDLDRAMAGHLQTVLDNRSLPVAEATKKFGQVSLSHSDLPGSFQSAVRPLLDARDYVEPVRKAMVAGGCNCSRALFIGACLGAKYGLSSIPMEWLEKTDSAKHALELAIQLAQMS